MSELEKDLVERVAKLPPELKKQFLDQATGAAMALEVLEQAQKEQARQAEDAGGAA